MVICIKGKDVLVFRDENNSLILPTWKEVKCWCDSWSNWIEEKIQYVFTLQGKKYFLWLGQAGEYKDDKYSYEPVVNLRQRKSKNICFGIMTAWHLYNWYSSNLFCGKCASKTVHDER